MPRALRPQEAAEIWINEWLARCGFTTLKRGVQGSVGLLMIFQEPRWAVITAEFAVQRRAELVAGAG